VNAAYGAVLKVEGSTVADTQGIGFYVTTKAKATLTNSVVVRTRDNEITSGHAVTVSKEAEATIVNSVLVDSRGLGVGSIDGAHVRVERSLIRSLGGSISNGISVGFGVNTASGSTTDVVDTTIVDALEMAAGADGKGPPVSLDKVFVTRSSGAKDGEYGHGVIATFHGIVDVKNSILERHKGVCLFYAGGGGTVSRSIVRANGIGAHVQDGSTLTEAASAPEASIDPELVVASDVQFIDNASKTGTGEIPLPALGTK